MPAKPSPGGVNSLIVWLIIIVLFHVLVVLAMALIHTLNELSLDRLNLQDATRKFNKIRRFEVAVQFVAAVFCLYLGNPITMGMVASWIIATIYQWRQQRLFISPTAVNSPVKCKVFHRDVWVKVVVYMMFVGVGLYSSIHDAARLIQGDKDLMRTILHHVPFLKTFLAKGKVKGSRLPLRTPGK